jgi:hypothetical protein
MHKQLVACISTSTGSIVSDGNEVYGGATGAVVTQKNSITIAKTRFSIASPTIVNFFLNAKATFSAGTVTAFGRIKATRVY